MTISASIERPSASLTARAAPSCVSIRATAAEVSIVTPCARASAAIAAEIAPMPPSACPQAPRLPFTSPKQ